MNVRLLRLLLPILLLSNISVSGSSSSSSSNNNNNRRSSSNVNNISGCSDVTQCSPAQTAEDIFLNKSRRTKRTVTLPNATFLTLQSRLIVPQLPVGLYIVWVRLRLVVRSMFTETTV